MLKSTLISVLLVSVACGCAANAVTSDDYGKGVRKVELGMSKAAFYREFPKALPRGARQYPGGPIEVIEVRVSKYSFVPTGNPDRNPLTGTESDLQWFYFYNDRLVQYGMPNDWPRDPDTIIELRLR